MEGKQNKGRAGVRQCAGEVSTQTRKHNCHSQASTWPNSHQTVQTASELTVTQTTLSSPGLSDNPQPLKKKNVTLFNCTNLEGKLTVALFYDT